MYVGKSFLCHSLLGTVSSSSAVRCNISSLIAFKTSGGRSSVWTALKNRRRKTYLGISFQHLPFLFIILPFCTRIYVAAAFLLTFHSFFPCFKMSYGQSCSPGSSKSSTPTRSYPVLGVCLILSSYANSTQPFSLSEESDILHTSSK